MSQPGAPQVLSVSGSVVNASGRQTYILPFLFTADASLGVTTYMYGEDVSQSGPVDQVVTINLSAEDLAKVFTYTPSVGQSTTGSPVSLHEFLNAPVNISLQIGLGSNSISPSTFDASFIAANATGFNDAYGVLTVSDAAGVAIKTPFALAMQPIREKFDVSLLASSDAVQKQVVKFDPLSNLWSGNTPVFRAYSSESARAPALQALYESAADTGRIDSSASYQQYLAGNGRAAAQKWDPSTGDVLSLYVKYTISHSAKFEWDTTVSTASFDIVKSANLNNALFDGDGVTIYFNNQRFPVKLSNTSGGSTQVYRFNFVAQ